MIKTPLKDEFVTVRESVGYKLRKKRCLIGLQKGVSKGLKGRLLQAY